MCGINGFIQFRRVKTKEEMYDLVHHMNDKIIHRGPNHEGMYSDEYCALGMRRLSIIDLEGGFQPIWNEDNSKLIIYNGEIYNYPTLYKDLISKGHTFQTHSDTEVILHGYEEYGIGIVDKLEGMFAFAIYDILRHMWIIARDKVGEKPLYYYSCDDYFVFASELKSIISSGLIVKEIDYRALSAYFQLTYIPSPMCILKNVYKLMPATIMIIKENGSLATKRYWKLNVVSDENHDIEYWKKTLREALYSSVEKRMISDVPLGAFLSGGFDSSIIVGIMSDISNSPINTFTIGYSEKQFDESPLANIVAKKNGTNHRVLQLDWNEVVEDIESLICNIDEPFADSSLIASYAVSKLTKQYVSVALTGDAGDELFAGYNKYLGNYYSSLYKRVPRIIRNGIINPTIKLLPKKSRMYRKTKKVIATYDLNDYQRALQLMSLGFKPNEMNQLMSMFDADALSFIEDIYHEYENVDEQTKMQYVDFNVVLEGDMLTKVDRASMLASLETRVPMLDTNVMELAFRIPTRYKITKKNRKIILKETFKDILPRELYGVPKHGFAVPMDSWLETVFKDRLLRYASESFLKEQGLFEETYINNLIKMHMIKRENRYSELWSFFVFQNWYERVILGELNAC